MGSSQRTKGASYEREVCHQLAASLGLEVKRNIGQARDGGDDITVAGLSVECKRRKRLGTVQSWLTQAATAAAGKGTTPVVVAREDNGQSIVLMRFPDFLRLFSARGVQNVGQDTNPERVPIE